MSIPKCILQDSKGPVPNLGDSSRDSTRKLFIGGLADKTTEHSLRDAFEEFGNVETVDLMMDKVTNRHRGFAFVTFSDSDAVDYCVSKYFSYEKKVTLSRETVLS